jgi:glyoxylase-like metal-dependent hydrolase (beta-lactamase superfamily II)
MVEKYNIDGYRTPVAALEEIGIAQTQVTDIIITHGHWDHIGGIYDFQHHGKIWINKKVFGSFAGEGPLKRLLRRAKKAGRLTLTKAITTVAPGIVTVTVGLHAPGFQYVVINNPNGVWVIASDIAPLLANFERGRPTGLTSHPEKTLLVQETIRKLVDGDLSHIIPGHEPRIYAQGETHAVVAGRPLEKPKGKQGPEAGNPTDSASSDR